MSFPSVRPRRLRSSGAVRSLVRETMLGLDDLIYPLFVVPGRGVRESIDAMPGVNHWSVDTVLHEVEGALSDGVRAVLLFGVPEHKDATGSSAHDPEGSVQQAVRAIKQRFPEAYVITDVCLCQYTDHGHCGLIRDGHVDNDASLEMIARTAVSHAAAGADMVAPSDMMDGRVGAIRRTLDADGFTAVPIMAYSAKYASAYYGPFREAAHSAPQFGDRRSYQMDPANAREALKEVALDLAEGADIIMVKPALAYMDVIHRVRQATQVPVAAYNVSGEYAMIKAAAQRGWIDEQRVVQETLTGIKRAGADLILTYFARDVARWIRLGEG